MSRKVVYLAAAAGLVGAAALLVPALAPAESAGDDASPVASLRTADGSKVGTVEFENGDHGVTVDVDLDVPEAASTGPAFHGLHVHANDDPANGEGCDADPGQPPDTWFTAVDGHLRYGDQAHGHHTGDLLPIRLDRNGRGRAEFEAGNLSLDDLDGRAVVLHADPDNFGNVPTGTGPDRYTANSPTATGDTAASGNAGTRLACGLIRTP